jgi:hypothetical protein
MCILHHITVLQEQSNLEMELVRICSLHGDVKNSYKSLVGKPEGKRPLGRFSVIGRIILKSFINRV